MGFNREEKEQLKELLLQVAPEIESYPLNTTTVGKLSMNGKTVIQFIAYGESKYLTVFSDDEDDTMNCDIYLRAEKNPHEEAAKDLMFLFDFGFQEGRPAFRSGISGMDENREDFIKSLKEAEELVLWIVDENKEPVSIFKWQWDWRDFAEVINQAQ